jgi:rhamnosyltransferase
MVSIIILTKNAGGNFRPLLEHIFSQKFDGRYEVLVVDSGSTDDTLSTAKNFPVKITKITPEDFHHGKTRNLGAQLSCGSILSYITQDALPLNNDWLQKLVDSLNDPNVAMVCGRQIPWQTTKPPEKSFYAYNFPHYKTMLTLDSWQKSSDCYRDTMFISNVNSAITKEIWQKFRFSENVVMAEDKEFAKRILFAGYAIVYEPDAAVYHAHDFSLLSAFQRCLDYGTSLNQGVGGLLKSNRSIVGRALKHLSEQSNYLRGNGYLKWLPYAILYGGSKFLGLSLGQLRGKILPKTGVAQQKRQKVIDK